MLVKAALGLKVPREDKPRVYITDAKAVEVPETAYYVRAVVCGDLLPAEAATAKPAKTADKKE
ncbi:MAG: hypothetical protein Q8S17_10740 [Humidesulfovibrio sp.]|nr:hypothetical protein [Humidesulfovibrio sp.]